MKKLVTILAIGLSSSVAFAQTALMADKPHDLSSGSATSVVGNTTQICAYCHVPHNANSGESALWARTNPTSTMDWDGLTMTVKGTTLPTTALAPSLRCFSCHDGSIGLGDRSGTLADFTVADAAGHVSGGMLIGTKKVDRMAMSTNHPVSIPYAGTGAGGTYNGFGSAAAAGDYIAVSTAQTYGIKFYGTGSNLGVECGSCHEPHNYGSGDTAPFLRKTKADSAICVSCHNK